MSERQNKGPMTLEKAAKLLTDVSAYRYNLVTFFQDFVSLSYLTLRNGIEPRNAQWQDRENEYLSIVKRYDRPALDAIAQCLGALILVSRDHYSDHMGELYMAIGTGNKGLGQFFTPYQISRLMASLTFDKNGMDLAIEKNGFVSVQEPTCGAGGMVVAAADVMREMGYDPEMHLQVTARDVDRHCCRMTYINCVLHRIPATIIWGDSLKLETREVIYTPALIKQHSQHKQAA